jgi:anti-sigma regulatory factor (Ser/Thr protein kinase)
MLRPATPPAGTVTFSCAYPARPDQLRLIRDDLRGLLAGCLAADEVILCASELAANAAIHSDSSKPGATLIVRAEIYRGEYVRIEVDDDGGPWAEPVPDPDRPHGLDIITALSTTWGIADTPAGRTVWASLRWLP